MTQITEAIYKHGVLKPLGDLELREEQRVRLIVESIEERDRPGRADALQRLRAGIEGMQFVLRDRLPSRDELHDRP